MKYSVIVFDLGNVLIPFDYSIMINYFNNLKEGLGDNFAARYKETYNFHRRFERGEVTNEEFISEMVSRLDNKITGEEFCRAFSSVFRTNDDVISLLPKLKMNYQIVLLSNTNEIHKKYGYDHYEFLKHFDKLFLSHEVGAVKPEEKIYRSVESYTQKKSEEHFFIDDIAEYVDGAKKCDWGGVQFTDYTNLLKAFEEEGIIF